MNEQTLLVKVNAPLKFRDATCCFHTKPEMNSSNNTRDYQLGDPAKSATGGSVSRSGRVRKKNSLLALYESPDLVEKKKRKSTADIKNDSGSPHNRSHEKPRHIKRKEDHAYKATFNELHNHRSASSLPKSIYHTAESYGLSHESFVNKVHDSTSEEIIGEDLLEDERGTELSDAGSVRLKSQAQSTYMLEKSFDRHRKVTGHIPGTKTKATRKDKGSPRVTAYMLWAKEQRSNFSKKFPHMDFTSLSKKLSDLWATVPQNQKRMWKTKAAKIMRKSANGAENIKNSGSPTSVSSKKSISSGPVRKSMKNTTPEEVYGTKRPLGRPPKKGFPTEPRFTRIDSESSANAKSYPNNLYTSDSNVIKSSTILSVSKLEVNETPELNAPSSSFRLLPAYNAEKLEKFKTMEVTRTDSSDVAAHLSLLGQSLKNMGEELQMKKDQSDSESLAVLLNSLLCSVGPLLCLTQKVPEIDCIPESQLNRIVNNVSYLMPGI
ncbi:unnamed protein product [Orchesella dallaii]|uniref:HMG box domain-containing protein n=1 Tax=Orchesella dallaii TaxID=48710 RepID=A0ABP1QVC3_9HEXA